MPAAGDFGGGGGGGSKFTDIEPGTYKGVLTKIIHLGEQEKEYKGEKWTQQQAFFQFLLPDELIEIDGEMLPRSVSSFITLSVHEKGNLWKICNSWGGGKLTYEAFKKMDLDKLLGKWGLVTMTLGQTGKVKLDTVAPLMKGMEPGECPEEPKSFWFHSYEGGPLPEWISKGIANIAMKSVEYQSRNQDAADIAAAQDAYPGGEVAVASTGPAVDDSDIPF